MTLEEHVDQLDEAKMSCDPLASRRLTAPSIASNLLLDTVALGNTGDHTSPQQEMDCTPSPVQDSLDDLMASHFLHQGKVGVASSEGGGAVSEPMTERVQSALESVIQEQEQQTLHKVDQKLFEKLNAKFLSQQTPSPPASETGPPLGKGSSALPFSVLALRERQVSSPSVETSKGSSLDTSHSEIVTVKVLNDVTPLAFGKGSSSLSSIDLDGLRISSMSDIIPYRPDDSFDVIQALFSNWPAIVTTILGFNPTSHSTPPESKSGHTPSTPPTRSNHAPSSSSLPHFSSVHLLDSFTTDLFLNCSDRVIEVFVSTIIQKLNTAVENAEDHHLPLLLQDIDYSDPERGVAPFLGAGEVGVALLVGRRFLASVVRVLALEHSRVKNRFLEMRQQQTRQDGKHWY